MGCIIDELPEAELFECYTHGENFGNYDNFKSKVTQGATEKSQFKTFHSCRLESVDKKRKLLCSIYFYEW